LQKKTREFVKGGITRGIAKAEKGEVLMLRKGGEKGGGDKIKR